MLDQWAAGFGTVSAGALTLFGIYAAIKTKGFALRALPAAIRQAVCPRQRGKGGSPFRAFATSLAGTIGVGNMTGVAVAIALGGAGAVFWMWVSAFLCMTVKYFEIYLALKHQPRGESTYGFGPMEYLKKATESRVFPALFAGVGILSAFGMGSLLQTGAAQESALVTFGIPPAALGAAFSLCVGVALWGGVRRVTGIAEKVIPWLGGAFLITGGIVIVRNGQNLLPALKSIFTQAFAPMAAAGGAAGQGVAAAFRHGVGNGLFSHEAGLGSAGLAHGTCNAVPERQGLWGIFEVFADTILISTVSALMLLTTEKSTVSAASATVGPWGEITLSVCLILFALLAILSWSVYGETCAVFLGKQRAIPIYRILFTLSPALAFLLPQSVLWQTSEIINACMMILNLTGLLGFRREMTKIATLDPKKL